MLNTPHKHHAETFTNDMANLHNELNYQHARLLLRRGVLVFGALYAYFWLIMEPDALDWRDTFDIKFNEKTYGTLPTSAGEGKDAID